MTTAEMSSAAAGGDAAPLVQLLYCSHLRAGADVGVYARIVASSRRNNPPLGITGALVFDGERFCQLLEGPDDSVSAMAQRIQADPRHAGFRMLHFGRAARRRLAIWSSGYCRADDLSVFDALNDASGAAGARVEQPLAAFTAIVAAADMWG